MPKPCDSCHSSSAVLYCRADAAYLCAGCDTKVHCANKLAQRHERVWVCDVCEVAPAVVTCKADAAALCVSCDTDIHSANPLARRHERAPVTPFFEFPGESMKVAHINAFMIPHAPHHHHHHHHHQSADREVDLDAEDRSVAEEAASWLLPHPKPLSDHMIDVDEKSSLGQGSLDTEQEDGDGLDSPSFLGTVGVGGFSPVSPLPENCLPKVGGGVNGGKPFKVEMSNNGGDPFSDLDPYLDLDYASAIGADPSSQPCDSLVPVRHSDSRATQSTSPSMSTGSGSFDGGAVCKNGGYSYPSQSLSSSSLDVGIVPDSSMSDSSNSYMDSISPGSFEFPAKGLQMGQVEPPMAREARVLRYREKRKNRKFEKTIRYASRKAYAESRPRIKGRFAKRTPSEISGMPEAYSAVQETGFGVVPAF